MKRGINQLPVVAGTISYDSTKKEVHALIKGFGGAMQAPVIKPTKVDLESCAYLATALATGLFIGDVSVGSSVAETIARMRYDIELVDGNHSFIAKPILINEECK